MRLSSIGLLLNLLVVVACVPRGPHKPTEGGLDGQAGVESGAVSYDQVRSIFAKNCAACHPSRSGPDWLNYDQASIYAQNGMLLKRAVTERSMPPPGSPQAATISDEERAMLGRWVKAGAPQHRGTAGGSDGGSGKSIAHVPAVVQQCFQCHGPQGPGAEAEPKIARLAGQNKEYLLNQLKAFKWRTRVDPSNTMNDMMSGVSSSDLDQMAEYYSTRVGLVSDHPRMTADERALYDSGEKLARTNCNSCHRNMDFEGDSSGPQVPILVGQSQQYLINQLLYFRNGERKNPLMNEYARVLSDQDISALAVYYSFCRR